LPGDLMGKVTRTPQAEESRLEIWKYIARDNVDAADRMIRRIDEKCALYADSPLLGDIREDLGSDIRRFHVEKYEVLYRSHRGGIVVLLVVHSSRDIASVFRNAFDAQS